MKPTNPSLSLAGLGIRSGWAGGGVQGNTLAHRTLLSLEPLVALDLDLDLGLSYMRVGVVPMLSA